MKPFNIEAAKAGKKVVDKRGNEVVILCYDYKVNKNATCLVGIIKLDSHDAMTYYTPTGHRYGLGDCEPELFMEVKKKKVEGWGNVYKSGNGSHFYASREIAEDYGKRRADYIASVYVSGEYEE